MKLTSRSPEETEEIGFKIGKTLKAGDVVGLYGELGTGKTTLVRGIARAFGIGARDVTSASFTIIAEYPGVTPLYHIDLYRIERSEDIEHIGIWECMGRDSVAVIEWAERLGDQIGEDYIRVEIEDRGADIREIRVKGIDERVLMEGNELRSAGGGG